MVAERKISLPLVLPPLTLTSQTLPLRNTQQCSGLQIADGLWQVFVGDGSGNRGLAFRAKQRAPQNCLVPTLSLQYAAAGR